MDAEHRARDAAPPPARLGADEVGGVRFWICAAAGLGIVAFGLIGLLSDPRAGSLSNWATFLIGGLVLHDGVFAPLVVVASLVAWWVLPRRARPVIVATAIVAGVVVLLSIPVLGRPGALPGNPSLLPRDYPAGLATALGVIALIGALAVVRVLRRPAPPTPPPPDRGGW